jgi:hypothetical protein
VRVEAAQHAILARVADSYRLKDLNSTNGTQVNVPAPGIFEKSRELVDSIRCKHESTGGALFCD